MRWSKLSIIAFHAGLSESAQSPMLFMHVCSWEVGSRSILGELQGKASQVMFRRVTFFCDLQGRKMNVANSKTLVGVSSALNSYLSALNSYFGFDPPTL